MIKVRKKQYEYAELITKIRNEYAKLQKENSELKIELQKCQDHIQNKPQRSYQKPSYQKPIRKRKPYYYDKPEESEESDSYVKEICRQRKSQRKRIMYKDEIDGLPEYEPNSLTDKDQEEGDYEIQTKRKEQKTQVEKPKKK